MWLQLLAWMSALRIDACAITCSGFSESHSTGWEEGVWLKTFLCSEMDCWACYDEISVMQVLENGQNMKGAL